MDCNSAIAILKEKNIIIEETSEKTEKAARQLKYSFDSDEVHYLDEDLMFTRPSEMRFENINYHIKSWKDAWMCLCEIMYEKNPEKFESLTDSPSFKTKKIDVFSFLPLYTDDGAPRNEKLNGTNIYVLISYNIKKLAELMRRLLIEFGYDVYDVEIYLRSDKRG